MSAALNTEQIGILQIQLQAQRRQLIEDIQQGLLQTGEERLHALAGSVHDSAEEAVSSLLVDVDTAIVQQHRHELDDAENALARIVDGNYGVCSDCGTGISYPRMEAYPTAKRCITCQLAHEASKNSRHVF
jgi:RNA polymerase-binding transcription factor DksA